MDVTGSRFGSSYEDIFKKLYKENLLMRCIWIEYKWITIYNPIYSAYGRVLKKECDVSDDEFEIILKNVMEVHKAYYLISK